MSNRLLSAHTIHSPNHLNENFWSQSFIKWGVASISAQWIIFTSFFVEVNPEIIHTLFLDTSK